MRRERVANARKSVQHKKDCPINRPLNKHVEVRIDEGREKRDEEHNGLGVGHAGEKTCPENCAAFCGHMYHRWVPRIAKGRDGQKDDKTPSCDLQDRQNDFRQPDEPRQTGERHTDMNDSPERIPGNSDNRGACLRA